MVLDVAKLKQRPDWPILLVHSSTKAQLLVDLAGAGICASVVQGKSIFDSSSMLSELARATGIGDCIDSEGFFEEFFWDRYAATTEAKALVWDDADQALDACLQDFLFTAVIILNHIDFPRLDRRLPDADLVHPLLFLIGHDHRFVSWPP